MTPLRDPALLDLWLMPEQKEHIFYTDTDPPQSATARVSLWTLGNRFVEAATEVRGLVAGWLLV